MIAAVALDKQISLSIELAASFDHHELGLVCLSTLTADRFVLFAYDNTIPACFLGAVQCSISHMDQIFRIVSMARKGGDSRG
jgi:hypothetical protein